MADLALSAAQAIFAALECTVLKEIFSIWGYKSQLEELKQTVSTIRKVLLGADAQHELSVEAQSYVKELKDAVYDADDLFDEILTLAHLKQHNVKPSKKVRDFFSSKNPLAVAMTTSKEVKKIKKKLEAIADNHSKFGFKFDSKPIRERREETCHYVYTPDIIGRDGDVKRVVDRLLGSGSTDENVDFLTIVGVGGLGKTTVAQLVYDDVRVKRDFPLRLWVCVADQEGQKFDVKSILSKIVDVADPKSKGGSSKEEVLGRFQECLGGEKCLLILDDVWNEDRLEWSKLREFLMVFGRGSRIVATTRSRETARVIGDGYTRTYELGGLSDEDSWSLFKLTALGKGRDQELPNGDFAEIGRKIVKQCCNVPLALKVVGTLLFGQGISKWNAFEKNGLAKISQGDNKIMSILKVSYDNLESTSKVCFSYCAVFPKDFVLHKEMLISLWMAQGYIKPFYEGQSMEDAGQEQFTCLLRRCFFQGVYHNEYGDVVSCKIHDLMHDVAQAVARKEICMGSYVEHNLGDHKIRHIFEDRSNFDRDDFPKCKIRSYLRIGRNRFDHPADWRIMVKPLISSWVCLSSLSLNYASFQELPDSIGKLLHLRYLDLYRCEKLKILPPSITKLHNLQTLILSGCHSLEALPKDMSKLVNLRYLDIDSCRRVTHMPTDIGKLTCLSVLTDFYIADAAHLEELKALKSLRGSINIRFPVDVEKDMESGYLARPGHLNSIYISIKCKFYTGDGEQEGGLTQKLQSDDNHRRFEVQNNVAGDSWAAFLPHLARIELQNCLKLQHLQHLGKLRIDLLNDLGYVEEDAASTRSTSGDGGASSSSSVARVSFLPFLKTMYCSQGVGGSDVPTRCPICATDFADGDLLTTLPHCGHVFDAACIDFWVSHHGFCPICRRAILVGG